MSTLRCSNDAYRHIFKRSSTGSFGKGEKVVSALMSVVWAGEFEAFMANSLSSDFKTSDMTKESVTVPDAILRGEVGENLKTRCRVSIQASEPSNVDRSPGNEIFHT
jgi:hypothetical protein